MLRNYLQPALRNLTRNKLYTLINVSGLVVGACSCIVICIVVAYEYSFDNFHPAGERVYRLGTRIKEQTVTIIPKTFPAYNGSHSKRNSGSRNHSGILSSRFRRPQFFTRCHPRRARIFFYLSLRLARHNPSSSLTYPFSVVLTQGQAKKYLGPLSPDRCLG